MRSHEQTRLLFGPYQAPALRRGARTTFLFKDCDVIITGWSDARLSWPRCRPVDVPRTHPSRLVEEELARAVRRESAAAVRHWRGVVRHEAWRWNEGTEARPPPVPRPPVQAGGKPLGRSRGGCKPLVKGLPLKGTRAADTGRPGAGLG
jgi:hypothetical protein